MPFKSQQQRKFMHARHPKIAKKWERETPPGRLPSMAEVYGFGRADNCDDDLSGEMERDE